MRVSVPNRFSWSYRAGLALALWCSGALAEPAKLDGVDPDRYVEHVRFLAAPEMKGRGAGTPELEQAAAYIAGQFRDLGLEPAGGEGSYRQPFVVTTGASMGPRNRFVVRLEGSELTLEPGQDYVPVSFSSAGFLTGGVVFAGYGVSAPEFEYDDYFHLDVTDKIVVVLRYEPEQFAEKRGADPGAYTHHSHLISKAINARDRGAKALLLVNGELEDEEEDLLLKFGSVAGPEDAGILLAHAKNEAVDEWLSWEGKSLAHLQAEIDEGYRPRSFSLPAGLTISLEVDIERKQAKVHNVAGYVSGDSDEYVIVGAHYDHLGLGDQSSLSPSRIGEVHPGADDNASGTAGLIELARLFAHQQESLSRGMLFVAFAGEEIGLLGSSHWVDHPTLPLDKAIAMINMDMIGRIRKSKVYVGGVGTGSTFESLLETASKHHDLRIDLAQTGYSSSDHTTFVGKRIPVLFFFSGLHADYHKPSDTWEKIKGRDAAGLLEMIAEVAGELQAAAKPPEFVEVDSPRHGTGRSGGGGGYGPYFGSVPDFGEIESGVKFADIRPGSPAAKAGLQAGDILIQFGDKTVKNLYDFTYALRGSKVGDVVEVKVLREGQEISARVKLEQRR